MRRERNFDLWMAANISREEEQAQKALCEAAFAKDPESRKLAQDRAIAHEIRREALEKVSSAHSFEEFHEYLDGEFISHLSDMY